MPPETFVGVGGSPSTNKKTTDFSVAFLLVGLSGLEPPTPTLSGWCSNRLSYNPIYWFLLNF